MELTWCQQKSYTVIHLRRKSKLLPASYHGGTSCLITPPKIEKSSRRNEFAIEIKKQLNIPINCIIDKPCCLDEVFFCLDVNINLELNSIDFFRRDILSSYASTVNSLYNDRFYTYNDHLCFPKSYILNYSTLHITTAAYNDRFCFAQGGRHKESLRMHFMDLTKSMTLLF